MEQTSRGSETGCHRGMKRAVAGCDARNNAKGARRQGVAHWKMFTIVRPVWEKVDRPTMDAKFPPLTLHSRRRRRSSS